MFEADTDRVAGPDGFSAHFFQSCWSIIQADFIATIKDFFKHGKFFKEVNSTHVVLIPKVKNAESLDQYRHIG